MKATIESIRIPIRNHALYLLVAVLILPCFSAMAEEQLLHNPTFDEPVLKSTDEDVIPKWWFTFSSLEEVAPKIFITRDFAKEEKQSVRFAPQRVAEAYQGLGQALAVEPKERYVFAAHVFIDPTNRMQDTVKGQMSIEWINEYDVEVERTWGPVWDWSATPGDWHKFEMTAQAHADAVGAVFVVTHFDAKDGREGGTFYVDDVSVMKWQPPAPPPAAEAVTPGEEIEVIPEEGL